MRKGEENNLTQCTAISFLPFPLSVQLVDVNISSHSDVVDLPVLHIVDWRRTTLHCNIIAVVQASSCVYTVKKVCYRDAQKRSI